MTDGGGTCQYVLDPTDGRTWGSDEDDRCYVDDELVPDGEFKTPQDDDTVFDDAGNGVRRRPARTVGVHPWPTRREVNCRRHQDSRRNVLRTLRAVTPRQRPAR